MPSPIYTHGAPIDPASRGLDPKRYRVTLSVDRVNEAPLTKADLAAIDQALAPELAASAAVYAAALGEAPRARPLPPPLAALLEAAGFRGTMSVQKTDGAPLSPRDERALARVLRDFTTAESVELTDGEISRAVSRLLASPKPAAPKKHRTR